MPTRRHFVVGGLAGAAQTALAAGAADARTRTTSTTGTDTNAQGKPIPSDAALITGLVQLEQLTVVVYERAAAASGLGRPLQRLAEQVLAHERAHLSALSDRLPALGAATPAAPSGGAAIVAALKPHHVDGDFAHVHTSKQWLKLLLDVEAMLERNYHLAISELRRDALVTLCAEILASEAQHAVLLRALRSPKDANRIDPTPFVNGG